MKKKIKAWADVGSHGGIFEFVGGPIGKDYPNLMNIYGVPHPGLIPVTIEYEFPPKKKIK